MTYMWVACLSIAEALDASMRGNGDSVAMSQSAYHVTGFASASDSSSDISSPNASQSPARFPVDTNGMKSASAKTRHGMIRMNSSPQPEDRNSFYENLQQISPTGKPPKVYASVAEMKKAKVCEMHLKSIAYCLLLSMGICNL